MQILFLADLCPNKLGSIEELFLTLSRQLAHRGATCHFAFAGPAEPFLRDLFLQSNARLPGFLFEKSTVTQQSAALSRYIRSEKIDVVHIHFFSLSHPLLFGAYLSPARIVFTEHTSGVPPQRSRLRYQLSNLWHSLLKRRIATYVAVSDFVRQRLAISHHLPPEQVRLIYNGVNLQRFAPQERQRARQACKLSETARIILAVAMLIPGKGLQTLVAALARLVADGEQNLLVVIAGEGWYQQVLSALAEELGVAGQVRFLGRRNDVEQLIAAADIVAVPAIWGEAFGLIAAEAMAAGRPVVAARSGALPELIEENVSGLLFTPESADDLARALSSLLREPPRAEELAARGRQRCIERFDLEQQSALCADVLINPPQSA